VARVLTLLTLLRHHYAPLVVARHHRAKYLETLAAANEGDLRPLVRLFARLEGVALRSELIRPTETMPQAASVVDVARAYADRLLALRQGADAEKRAKVTALAFEVHTRLGQHLGAIGSKLRETFQAVDATATAGVISAAPGEDRGHYWRTQLISTANAVDFFANLSDGCWWTRMKLTVLGQELRYVAAVQKVGRGETGVLAVTVFAELPPTDRNARPVQLLDPTSDDAVTLVHTDTADGRWLEVAELVDRTLTGAVSGLANALG
jgi:hypothetical protein